LRNIALIKTPNVARSAFVVSAKEFLQDWSELSPSDEALFTFTLIRVVPD
jgi:hypothetical protein